MGTFWRRRLRGSERSKESQSVSKDLMLDLSPERQFDVGRGIELCARTAGDPSARPLVLIAGWTQHLNTWPVPLLALFVRRGFFVVVFDNRDVGRSTHVNVPPPTTVEMLRRRFSAEQYTLEDMAQDTIGLLDALELSRAHIVGKSMGGMIGQILAAEHPDRILTLTSIMSRTGARRTGRTAKSTWIRMGASPAKTAAAHAKYMASFMRHIGSNGYPFDEDAARAEALEAWERDDGPNADGVSRQLGAIFKSEDRTALCGRITVPTLVIHGDGDRMVHTSGGRATAAAIPKARLRVYPGMGHDLPSELWEQIVDDIVSLTEAQGS